MDKETLARLLEASHAVGANPDYVQGGGGNTSAKSADGKTMLVKASGTALSDMSESAGWVAMDASRALALLDAGLENLPSAEREHRVLEGLYAAVTGGPAGRPSVESALHAQLGKVVIHTHPAAVNAINCGPGEAALAELSGDDAPPPLWIPFAPGYLLAQAVKKGIAEYKAEHGAAPAVFFLENHGIFVSADDAEACLKLHEEWTRRCEDYFAPGAPALKSPKPPEPDALRAAMAAVRKAVAKKTGKPVFLRLSDYAELSSAAATDVADTLAAGALSPDQIVYCGTRAVAVKALEDAPAALAAAAAEPGSPRIMILRNAGTFLISDAAEKLDVIESVASGSARTIRLAAGKGGARNLGEEASDFIVGWEAEHYRAGLLEDKAQELAGKVGVVTGAASGLGCGIAQGLVKAGAAVAFCDLNAEGARIAAEESDAPGRTLAVKMDVTSEDAVRAGFDAIIRHWGGLDIVVPAAGVAPPFNLVDMPVDKWRLALEVNLTGYFLAAREAARIMKAQGGGGSIVLVSSKTGLEASKANSAYNATKAGELGLARGWALELGPDGIRVNAVAPGNVFEGSNIWNPEYIAKCAEKKGIKPEEVIVHYNSLTALGQEIKREDVAEAVIFLCSDRARRVTGQTLVIDGGQVMTR